MFRPTYGENSRSFFGLASKSAAVALFTGRPSKIRVKCELTIQIKTTNKFWRESGKQEREIMDTIVAPAASL